MEAAVGFWAVGVCPNGKFEFLGNTLEKFEGLKVIKMVEIENRINIEGAHRYWAGRILINFFNLKNDIFYLNLTRLLSKLR